MKTSTTVGSEVETGSQNVGLALSNGQLIFRLAAPDPAEEWTPNLPPKTRERRFSFLTGSN